jgi:hypothetical protein
MTKKAKGGARLFAASHKKRPPHAALPQECCAHGTPAAHSCNECHEAEYCDMGTGNVTVRHHGTLRLDQRESGSLFDDITPAGEGD